MPLSVDRGLERGVARAKETFSKLVQRRPSGTGEKPGDK